MKAENNTLLWIRCFLVEMVSGDWLKVLCNRGLGRTPLLCGVLTSSSPITHSRIVAYPRALMSMFSDSLYVAAGVL